MILAVVERLPLELLSKPLRFSRVAALAQKVLSKPDLLNLSFFSAVTYSYINDIESKPLRALMALVFACTFNFFLKTLNCNRIDHEDLVEEITAWAENEDLTQKTFLLSDETHVKVRMDLESRAFFIEEGSSAQLLNLIRNRFNESDMLHSFEVR